jgi:predicted RNA-binding Zn-ribbon protein involved in translation (DUF1610 family)
LVLFFKKERLSSFLRFLQDDILLRRVRRVTRGIKSRPIYDTLRLDTSGYRHLAVSDHTPFPFEAFETALTGVELWQVCASPVDGATVFNDEAALFAALEGRLQRESAGFRLYAVGTESFIWDAANIARRAGMTQGEFFVAHTGSLRRRVYCTHCKAMIENVTTNLVSCTGCGATLFVRDHFSRRLAAFMGIQADVEEPGVLPPLETLYP